MQRLYWQFGEDESPEPHRQARQVMDGLTIPSELRVMYRPRGGKGHRKLNNSSRMQEAAFDWLDELWRR
jgi:hypothetical protein